VPYSTLERAWLAWLAFGLKKILHGSTPLSFSSLLYASVHGLECACVSPRPGLCTCSRLHGNLSKGSCVCVC